MDAPKFKHLTRQGAADARAGKVSIANSFASLSEQHAYQRGYEHPHADFERWLGDQIDAQSEAIKIEYRRREDQALAVVSVAKTVWDGIYKNSEQLQKLEESRWRKANVVVFFLGIAISALRWDSFSVDIGRGLIVLAMIAYVYCLVIMLDLRWRLAGLEQQQTSLLREWLASGASENDWHSFRLLPSEPSGYPAHGREAPDKYCAELTQLEYRRTGLWLDVKCALLERSGAELPRIPDSLTTMMSEW